LPLLWTAGEEVSGIWRAHRWMPAIASRQGDGR
jgi:hypothetical protein